jgi:2-keto-4-pentenoate hydratase
MLDRNQIAAASRTLNDHWRAGTKLDGLDTSYRPRDRAEGYAIQAEIERTSGGQRFGWKIAATSEAGQKHINVDGPMLDASCSKPLSPMAARPRWRETRCASPSPNSPSA